MVGDKSEEPSCIDLENDVIEVVKRYHEAFCYSVFPEVEPSLQALLVSAEDVRGTGFVPGTGLVVRLRSA